MKATIRVPMKESFGYIEFEAEVERNEKGVSAATQIYKDALKLSKEAKSDNDF
jgi:hypothetical protein